MCIEVIQIIHLTTCGWPGEVKQGWDEIGVGQVGCEEKLSSDLQGWGDYNVNRRRLEAKCKAILYREYKGGGLSPTERQSPWKRDWMLKAKDCKIYSVQS